MVPKISAGIIDQTQNSVSEVYDQTVHFPVTSIDRDFGVWWRTAKYCREAVATFVDIFSNPVNCFLTCDSEARM